MVGLTNIRLLVSKSSTKVDVSLKSLMMNLVNNNKVNLNYKAVARGAGTYPTTLPPSASTNNKNLQTITKYTKHTNKYKLKFKIANHT